MPDASAATAPSAATRAATVREGTVVRVLSRNHPEVDEGWLCDKGRFAHTALDAERPDHGAADPRRPRARAGRGPDGALDHIADRLRATVERFGPGSVAILASGEQTNEEAHAWARIRARRWAAAPVRLRPRGRRRLGAARALRGAASPTSTRPTLIVVVGDAELAAPRAGDRAAHPPGRCRRGAQLVTVGAGGTRLELAARRGAHLDGPRHGARRPARRRRRPRRAGDGARRPARGDRLDRPDVRAGRRRARARGPRAGAGVLRTPGRGERARLPAAGLGGTTPEEVLRAGRGGRRQGDRPAGRRPGRRLARRRALAGCPRTLRSSRSRCRRSRTARPAGRPPSCPPPPRSRRRARSRISRAASSACGRRVPPPSGVARRAGVSRPLGAQLALELRVERRGPSPAWPLGARRSPASAGRRWASGPPLGAAGAAAGARRRRTPAPAGPRTASSWSATASCIVRRRRSITPERAALPAPPLDRARPRRRPRWASPAATA